MLYFLACLTLLLFCIVLLEIALSLGCIILGVILEVLENVWFK